MVPSIDQTLSLKTKLKDEITPGLQKISQGLKTTQEAINSFVSAVKKATRKVPQEASSMERGTTKSTKKMKKELGATGQAFDTLEEKAKSSSENIGRAIKDSLYTKGASKSFKDLNKDFGELKETFEGMASTSRPASIKAGKVKAIGKDTLNKKVIPAFQALHDTLDDFPDVIADINSAQGVNIKETKKFTGILGGVSERIEGLGDSFKQFKFDVQDLAGAIAGTVTYQAADKLQTMQGETMTIAGLDDAAKLPSVIGETLKQSQAPIEVWGEALKKMQGLTETSAEAMPGLISQFVNMSKVTGLSVNNMVDIHDQMVNISGMREGEFSKVIANMNQMAKEGRISMEELGDALTRAAVAARSLSEEGRKAYAEAMLAGSATLKELGADGITSIEDMSNAIKNDKDAFQKAMNMANMIGVSNQEFTDAYQAGEMDKVTNWAMQGQRHVVSSMSSDFAEGKTLTPFQRDAIQRATGIDASDDYLGLLQNMGNRLGEVDPSFNNVQMGTREAADMTTAHFREKYAQGSEMAMQDQVMFKRNLIPEQRERGTAALEQAQMRLGEQAAPVIQNAQGKMLEFAQDGINKFLEWDDKYNRMFSSAMAYYGLASPLKTFLKNVTQFIPFVGDKISGAMDGLVGGSVATGGIILALKGLFGGGDGPSPGPAPGASSLAPVAGVTASGSMTLDPFEAEAQRRAQRQAVPNTWPESAAPTISAGTTVPAGLEPIAGDGPPTLDGYATQLQQQDVRDWVASGAFKLDKAIVAPPPPGIAQAMNQPETPGQPRRLKAPEPGPAYMGQVAQHSGTAAVASGVAQFQDEGPSILKAIGSRLERDKKVVQAALDTLIPFRKESAAIVKIFAEMKKNVVKKQIGAIKDFVSNSMRVTKTVMVDMIGGIGESQRQQAEVVKAHLAAVKNTTNLDGATNVGEISNRVLEAQLEQHRQQLEVTKEMKDSIKGMAAEGQRLQRTQGLRPHYSPAEAGRDNYKGE